MCPSGTRACDRVIEGGFKRDRGFMSGIKEREALKPERAYLLNAADASATPTSRLFRTNGLAIEHFFISTHFYKTITICVLCIMYNFSQLLLGWTVRRVSIDFHSTWLCCRSRLIYELPGESMQLYSNHTIMHNWSLFSILFIVFYYDSTIIFVMKCSMYFDRKIVNFDLILSRTFASTAVYNHTIIHS